MIGDYSCSDGEGVAEDVRTDALALDTSTCFEPLKEEQPRLILHSGAIAPPRPLLHCRLTRAQEALLMQKTAELFVPTMRALYHIVGKPSEETWPEQALPTRLPSGPPPIGRWRS